MKIWQFFSTTIGKKVLVALTGLFMIFFLLAHLAANLEIYAGPHALNQYGAWLRTMPKTLWGFRIALIMAVVLHVGLTISLARANTVARPKAYGLKKSRAASLASRTMILSGFTVLAFVIYHLAHFTLGITNPEFMTMVDSAGHHHVYNMVVMGFQNPLVAGFYILAQLLLAFHLSHGFASACRTMGLSRGLLYDRMRTLGLIFAITVALLYISIPLSVLGGWLALDL